MDYNGSFIPRKTKNIRKDLIFAFFQDIQLKALNVKTFYQKQHYISLFDLTACFHQFITVFPSKLEKNRESTL